MTEICDSKALRNWLTGKAVEFASVLTARIALRVVPVLQLVLHEAEKERRFKIILPSFRALAATSYVGAWPSRAAEVRNVARGAGQEAGSLMGELADGAQIDLLEAREAIPDIYQEIRRLEADARALRLAERAVNTVLEATNLVVAIFDAAKEIGSSAAVHEAATSAAQIALNAIDGIHGDTELLDDAEENGSEESVVPHIEEFWNAVALDVEWLESDRNAKAQPEEMMAHLSRELLWIGGTPVWASKWWADFKDRLPDTEGWQVWTDWYEARLAGRRLDQALEADLLKIPSEEWRKGPAHVNEIAAKLIKLRSDPLLAAVEQGFEDLEAIKLDSSIDLTQYMRRIRNALPNDPYQAIGATKDMLEATMKTILDRRGGIETDKLDFPKLTTRCLRELGLIETSAPATVSERHLRKFASNAQKMIKAANEFRNLSGTGHGRVTGKEPVVTEADARLNASVGLALAAWLIRHDAEA